MRRMMKPKTVQKLLNKYAEFPANMLNFEIEKKLFVIQY